MHIRFPEYQLPLLQCSGWMDGSMYNRELYETSSWDAVFSQDVMSDTHHLNLSILTDAVDLDLLIGQCVMQSLLCGSLRVGSLPCNASLWGREKTQGLQ